jgi:PAS domain-containing protein
VGKTDYDINPEAIADVGYRLESSAFAEGRRVNEHQQLPTQNGAQRWIDNRKYPINGPGGEIIGILGIAPDITVYVEAEGRLRESEESLRQAQKIAGLGSYALDNLSGVWTSSEVMDEIFGIDRAYERTVGGWLDLIHPDDRSAMGAYFEHEVLGQGKPLDRE